MFNPFAKPAQPKALQLRRVLIVDDQPAPLQALGEMLRQACGPEIWAASTTSKALKLAAKIDPELIFCELALGVDSTGFTRALRRSDLACRQAPVILVTAQASPAAMLAGRDAGAHELLRRPFTRKDVMRRLEAATLHPRDWVEAMDYVGPDRRRFNSAEYEGALKRLADSSATPQGVRVGEALKIIRSALGAIERDPSQALRALIAQTSELERAAAEISDQKLATAASELQHYLSEVGAGGALNAAEATNAAAALLNAAGRDVRAAA